MMKLRKAFKTLLVAISLIIFVLIILQLIPPKKFTQNNSFIFNYKTIICINTENGDFGPSNTYIAYDDAIKSGADALYVPLVLTKDENIICFDDFSLNDKTDVELITGNTNKYYISDHTLSELEVINFGYGYNDIIIESTDLEKRKEELINNNLSVVTLDNLLNKYSNENIKFIFEIKDKLARAESVISILLSLVDKYELEERVLIISNDYEINTKFKQNNNLFLSTDYEKNIFYVTELVGINLFFNSSYKALKLDKNYMISLFGKDLFTINSLNDNFINRLHRKNVAVIVDVDNKDDFNYNADIFIIKHKDLID